MNIVKYSHIQHNEIKYIHKALIDEDYCLPVCQKVLNAEKAELYTLLGIDADGSRLMQRITKQLVLSYKHTCKLKSI